MSEFCSPQIGASELTPTTTFPPNSTTPYGDYKLRLGLKSTAAGRTVRFDYLITGHRMELRAPIALERAASLKPCTWMPGSTPDSLQDLHDHGCGASGVNG